MLVPPEVASAETQTMAYWAGAGCQAALVRHCGDPCIDATSRRGWAAALGQASLA